MYAINSNQQRNKRSTRTRLTSCASRIQRFLLSTSKTAILYTFNVDMKSVHCSCEAIALNVHVWIHGTHIVCCGFPLILMKHSKNNPNRKHPTQTQTQTHPNKNNQTNKTTQTNKKVGIILLGCYNRKLNEVRSFQVMRMWSFLLLCCLEWSLAKWWPVLASWLCCRPCW